MSQKAFFNGRHHCGVARTAHLPSELTYKRTTTTKRSSIFNSPPYPPPPPKLCMCRHHAVLGISTSTLRGICLCAWWDDMMMACCSGESVQLFICTSHKWWISTIRCIALHSYCVASYLCVTYVMYGTCAGFPLSISTLCWTLLHTWLFVLTLTHTEETEFNRIEDVKKGHILMNTLCETYKIPQCKSGSFQPIFSLHFALIFKQDGVTKQHYCPWQIHHNTHLINAD